ncbi:uncharacterized protein LOC119734121 [Patiria miniata]|uniref:CCHC-type domain-containing protein n=1 Tax=Patiria miniata TaxID=46514 RepID=A0A914AHD8_PATMI|nr:uncharacterized protein LOC119734121 [Patiria miniata]
MSQHIDTAQARCRPQGYVSHKPGRPVSQDMPPWSFYSDRYTPPPTYMYAYPPIPPQNPDVGAYPYLPPQSVAYRPDPPQQWYGQPPYPSPDMVPPLPYRHRPVAIPQSATRAPQTRGVTPEDRKPRVLPKTLEFDGKLDWSLYKRKFETYAMSVGWTESQKKDMLIWGLTGKAADFYVLLSKMNEDLSYSHLISEFNKRFKREELPETLQARFQLECQEEGETLRDWADKILSLAAKAYKDLPEAWIRKNAIIRFCMGSLDKEAGQHACIQQPKTFDEAMDKMEWFRCISKSAGARHAPQKLTKSAPPVRAYKCASYEFGENDPGSEEEEEEDLRIRKMEVRRKQSTPQPILKRESGNKTPEPTQDVGIAGLAKQMSQMTVATSALTKQVAASISDLTTEIKGMFRELGRQRSTSPSRRACYLCGDEKHFARECPTKDLKGKETKVLRFEDEQPKSQGTKTEAGFSPQ